MHVHPLDSRLNAILRSGDLVAWYFDPDLNGHTGLVIGVVQRAPKTSYWTYSVLFPRGLRTYSRRALKVVANAV